MLPARESLAISQLVLYIPAFFATIFVVIRHGFHRQAGWIFLAILALLRIVGSGLEIASVKNPQSTDDFEWAAILQSVGISPLLMASLGLLKRITEEFLIEKGASTSSYRSLAIGLLQIPCVIALILCIIGGTDVGSTNSSDRKTGLTHLKEGLIIFAVVWAALWLLTILTVRDWSRIYEGERRVLIAVVVAVPLLALRILYGVLSVFVDKGSFSFIGGGIVPRVLLATVEEFLIVIIFIGVGLTVPKFAKQNEGRLETVELGI
ncbi:hypothetical protein K432DRAFT_285396 [Lepidopterella palustris CBS 459.81]|uniref:DUF7702 domain-containing protein n=1 Tax=Lepidopterella palustris CBS 459.81 TaxID=1314670 RepID=A0A8E2JKR8_9PEZI|nr:hypothetical protein K432DRAFT_285396 [Lepidopterella palustris CBS 459.81]